MLAKLSIAARKQDPEDVDQWDDISVHEAFEREGFSKGLAGRLLRPFFEGVLLDPDLGTDASLFRSYFSLFSRGRGFVPRGGMASIPRKMAEDLPRGSLRCAAGIREILRRGDQAAGVILEDGEIIEASKLILATELSTSTQLLGRPSPPMGRETTSLYFSSAKPLYSDKLIVLPGGRHPLVRLYVQLSNVNPEVAPLGQHLLSASLVGPTAGSRSVEALFEEALEEISIHEPGAAEILEPLHGFRVRNALPAQTPTFRKWHRDAFSALPGGMILAGDHTTQGSIQGAILSGERAAIRAMTGR